MSGSWWHLAVGIVAALVLMWLALLATLWRIRPGAGVLRESVRLLPDLLRLLARLVKDPSLPRGIRIRVAILLGYLALPIDIVPDFIPVIGYADDIIMIIWILRSTIRTAGPDAITRHWPGTPDGLAAILRLCAHRSGPTNRPHIRHTTRQHLIN